MPEKNKNPWYVAGLHFECHECGQCCSGPDEGYIWITRKEIELISDFLKMPTEQLRKTYLKRVGLRTTITEQPVTKDCIFLQKTSEGQKQCTIYLVRPNQCRTWPFWTTNLTSPNTWNEATQKCLGINRGKHYSYEEIEKIKKQKWWQDAAQQRSPKKSS